MYQDRRVRGGFTFVELLSVIVIIVILATLATVAYSGVQRRAGVSVVKSSLSDANKEILAEELRTNQVPAVIPASFV